MTTPTKVTFEHHPVTVTEHRYTVRQCPPVPEWASHGTVTFHPSEVTIRVASTGAVLQVRITGHRIIGTCYGPVLSSWPADNIYTGTSQVPDETFADFPAWITPLITDATSR